MGHYGLGQCGVLQLVQTTLKNRELALNCRKLARQSLLPSSKLLDNESLHVRGRDIWGRAIDAHLHELLHVQCPFLCNFSTENTNGLLGLGLKTAKIALRSTKLFPGKVLQSCNFASARLGKGLLSPAIKCSA